MYSHKSSGIYWVTLKPPPREIGQWVAPQPLSYYDKKDRKSYLLWFPNFHYYKYDIPPNMMYKYDIAEDKFILCAKYPNNITVRKTILNTNNNSIYAYGCIDIRDHYDDPRNGIRVFGILDLNTEGWVFRKYEKQNTFYYDHQLPLFIEKHTNSMHMISSEKKHLKYSETQRKWVNITSNSFPKKEYGGPEIYNLQDKILWTWANDYSETYLSEIDKNDEGKTFEWTLCKSFKFPDKLAFMIRKVLVFNSILVLFNFDFKIRDIYFVDLRDFKCDDNPKWYKRECEFLPFCEDFWVRHLTVVLDENYYLHFYLLGEKEEKKRFHTKMSIFQIFPAEILNKYIKPMVNGYLRETSIKCACNLFLPIPIQNLIYRYSL